MLDGTKKSEITPHGGARAQDFHEGSFEDEQLDSCEFHELTNPEQWRFTFSQQKSANDRCFVQSAPGVTLKNLPFVNTFCGNLQMFDMADLILSLLELHVD